MFILDTFPTHFVLTMIAARLTENIFNICLKF